jgi:hypothetical protein
VLTFYNQVFPSTAISKALNWVKPVGTLSGKSSLAILAFVVAWTILAVVWRGREVRFGRVAVFAMALLLVGLLGTFPPVWHLFIPPIPHS